MPKHTKCAGGFPLLPALPTPCIPSKMDGAASLPSTNVWLDFCPAAAQPSPPALETRLHGRPCVFLSLLLGRAFQSILSCRYKQYLRGLVPPRVRCCEPGAWPKAPQMAACLLRTHTVHSQAPRGHWQCCTAQPCSQALVLCMLASPAGPAPNEHSIHLCLRSTDGTAAHLAEPGYMEGKAGPGCSDHRLGQAIGSLARMWLLWRRQTASWTGQSRPASPCRPRPSARSRASGRSTPCPRCAGTAAAARMLLSVCTNLYQCAC